MMLRRLYFTFSFTILWQLNGSLALAQTRQSQQSNQFPPNPLEITTPDPLLPPLINQQQLTLPQRRNLERSLDQLNQEATAKLQAGDQQAAFDIWNRELRLRRYLSSLAEVQALGRVGAIAWNQNNSEQVQFITQRLQSIQQQAQSQTTINLELMRSLGQAYQQVRSPRLALEAYNQVLTVVRQQQDANAILQTLNTIGELHLAWFDYTQAAGIYEELLNLAVTQGDRSSELTYLQELAYIYQRARQPQQAINILNRLIEIYQQANNFNRTSQLNLALGSQYEALAQQNPSLLQEAFNNYQVAYVTAWQSQQYARAGEALQKLIQLYRSQGQIDEALQATQILIETQKQAVNFYGMMQGYNQMGQLHLERKDYPQALTAFQQGLQLAQQLRHEEAYFTQQIEKLTPLQ